MVDKRPSVRVLQVLGYGLRFVISYSPKMFFLMCILGILHGVMQGFTVLVTQFLFDSVEGAVTGYGQLRMAYFMVLALGATTIAREVLNGADNIIIQLLYEKYSGGIQRVIHRKMSLIDPVAFENISFHEDIEKANQGKWNVLQLTFAVIWIFIFFVPYFVFMGFYLHYVSPRFIFAIVFVFLPTLFSQIIRTKIISKFVDVTSPIRREHDYYYNAISNKAYYKETRILGAYTFFFRRFIGMMQKLSRAELAVNRKISLLELGMSFLSTAGYVGILVMLVSALLRGEISVGAFAAVYGSVGMMFGMMEQIIQHQLGRAAEGMGFAHNFMRFMALPERESHGGEPDLSQGISLKYVSFTYPLAEKKSIDGVNLEIPPGETVAIVGKNGAGKSTLVRLMIGLYKPDEGTVTLSGLDTSKADFNALFKHLSGVFQRYQRYQLTLKDNIQMGDKNSSDEIARSLNQAGVELDSGTYPNGEDTMLGRDFDGVDLSGGQWQRVAIARGLYRAHSVVVLDEPTAAIDPIEESRIYEKFIEISKQKTAIIVTHRLGSAKIADRVVVVDEGKVVDIGKHEELLAREGLYSEMFKSQAEWYYE